MGHYGCNWNGQHERCDGCYHNGKCGICNTLWFDDGDCQTNETIPFEAVRGLKNPYSPLEHQGAFVGFETAKSQLLMKFGKEKQKNKWIRNERKKSYIRTCPVCDGVVYMCMTEKDYDFCPWCATDMRGGKDEIN